MSAQELDVLAGPHVVDGISLVKLGSSVRKVFMFEVYRIHLYGPGRLTDSEILGLGRPLRLVYEYLYGPISRDRTLGAWKDMLERTVSDADRESVASDLAKFLEVCREIQKGDTITYEFSTTGTITVRINGSLEAVIASRTLAVSILRALFGDEPMDAKIKAELLGSK